MSTVLPLSPWSSLAKSSTGVNGNPVSFMCPVLPLPSWQCVTITCWDYIWVWCWIKSPPSFRFNNDITCFTKTTNNTGRSSISSGRSAGLAMECTAGVCQNKVSFFLMYPRFDGRWKRLCSMCLSLSCAWLLAGRMITLWVRRPM